MRLLVVILLVLGAFALLPASASAAGTCTAIGKSVAPDLGDHGTQLTVQCTDTIATTSFNTNALMNGLQWSDAKDCNFEDRSWVCHWQPTQQAGGVTYTHGHSCDRIDYLRFDVLVTFADGSSVIPFRVNGPCHGPPKPKPNRFYTGLTPQKYHAYVRTAPGRPHVREIGIGFQCRHGDSRARAFTVGDFAVKLGTVDEEDAYVFGDDFTSPATFQKTGRSQGFHAHLSGYVASSKNLYLEYRLSRPGCDTGLRHFTLHTK
jgi:hypothetical protein